MGNINIDLVKRIAESLMAIFSGIPEAQARKEHADADIREADADIRRTEAGMKKVEAYDLTLKFLKKAGFSEGERKAMIAYQITAKGEHDNMIENIRVISDLVKRKRINFQITGETDKPDKDEDDPQRPTTAPS